MPICFGLRLGEDAIVVIEPLEHSEWVRRQREAEAKERRQSDRGRNGSRS
jgi:hypothetical protein